MRCPMCGWSVKEDKRIAELEARAENVEAERDRMRAVLAEWTVDQTECGCDTDCCMGTCLPARSRTAMAVVEIGGK